jgi:hypothetical protein
MTNGTLTKKIIKAAKTVATPRLAAKVTPIFSRFPLSSHNLLYPSDRSKVSTEAWTVLERVATETDRIKAQRCNIKLRAARCKPYTSYGRWEK